MNSEFVTCPLCRGQKKVFQVALFRKALQASKKHGQEELAVASFVRDCSVCAGNGWVINSALEAAQMDAEAWRSSGVCAY